MSDNMLKYRWLQQRLPGSDSKRVILLTGARQTGKTTLVKQLYPELNYINLDSLENRETMESMRTAAWGTSIGDAIIDEAQKLPSVFEKVKYAYDAGAISFTVLTGSSRVLLMDNIKETLAGRVFVFELWPLMASEIAATGSSRPPSPLIKRIFRNQQTLSTVLSNEPEFLLGDTEDRSLSAVNHLMQWGGMPELLTLSDNHRLEWLRSYQQTYLERDLSDLVNLRQLQPFSKLQKLAMLRSGQLLSYSELARDAQLSVDTVRRYLAYLEKSYQIILLEPFHRNLTSRVIKTPKVYWLDLGLLRQGTGQWESMTGSMFETLVISEVHKWFASQLDNVSLTFYRTRSGLEVDLMIQQAGKVHGLEIKNRGTISRIDSKNLIKVAEALHDEWSGGIVLYRGRKIELINPRYDIWAIPIHRFFCA